MQHPVNDLDLTGLTTQLAVTMGFAYRTPSPVREAYLSTSNVNSPRAESEAHDDRSEQYAKYEQCINSRASGIAAAEADKQHQRHVATLSRLQDFHAKSNTSDQKPGGNTLNVNDEGLGGVVQAEEPCTPKKKHVPILWHGLPSPETPTFDGKARDTPSADFAQSELAWQTSLSDTKSIFETAVENATDDANPYPFPARSAVDTENIDDEDTKIVVPQTPLHTLEYDERLARELEESLSPTTTRRSTRLRKQPKPTYAIQVPVAAQKTARKILSPAAAPEPVSRPECSTEPVKVDPIPFEGLPSVHSLSWQIQYPPGGSTHPSYPYPAMDPRLLFHQAFVPLIGGLPDFALVPKLVLPMGWKQVSWSGLLPIVFDPYRQAFKLTPVGPMPLTCEELHQQGLHKYVPGGELHPEYGILPDMLKFSDGSDAEVFNFDGADWTLPWEGQMDFHAPSSEAMNKRESEASSPPSSPFDFIPAIPSRYNEAWDCPDGIIDLPDAWRWLSEQETRSATGFVASPGKTWRGTGSHRVARRYKQPIASLMSTTIANLVSDPTEIFLVNQDSREFCAFRSVATPVHVNIALLGDVEFTLKELLSYFPWHYYWRKAADRFVKAGLNGGDVTNMINLTRKLEGDAARKSSSITGNLMYETLEDGTRVKIVRSNDENPGFTAQDWSYDQWEPADYPLLGLAHGLVELPTGEDAGPLTKMMIWCRDQGKYRTMLSEVPALLEEAGIDKKIKQPEVGCPDQIMLLSHSEAVREDRKRVIATEKLVKRKRELEGKEETRGRKKKAC